MAVPNTVQCNVIWTLDTTPWAMNVIHFQRPPLGIQQADADAVAAVVGAAFDESNIDTHIANSVTLQSVQLQDISFNNGPVFVGEIAAPGQSSRNLLPRAISLAVQQYTSMGSQNGRIFQWGYSDFANNTSGGPAQTTRLTVVDFWDQIRTEVPATTQLGDMVVVHRGSSDTSVVTAIRRTASSQNMGWQTQRRRTDGLPVA